MALFETQNLKKFFTISKAAGKKDGHLKAVDDVSVRVDAGETLGLVGESGCGKSTLGKLALGLYQPTSGTVTFNGQILPGEQKAQRKNIRRQIQIIFQDPYSSLNPRMNVGSILAEPFKIHKIAGGGEIRILVEQLLVKVGLKPEDRWRYPHEFSGGQRQRIGIARALSLNPKMIVADEPVSSLDVSIQAQILNLLMDLQEEMGLAYLFISHDLSVIRHISHRVAVMYLGRIVETGSVEEIFLRPLHPYTEALLAAIPIIGDARRGQKTMIGGDIPSPVNPPPGCYFHPRCPIRGKKCTSIYPELREISTGRSVSCHYRG